MIWIRIVELICLLVFTLSVELNSHTVDPKIEEKVDNEIDDDDKSSAYFRPSLPTDSTYNDKSIVNIIVEKIMKS